MIETHTIIFGIIFIFIILFSFKLWYVHLMIDKELNEALKNWKEEKRKWG